MKILAIESSCDDLSVCVYQTISSEAGSSKTGPKGQIIALNTASQVEAHQKFGGVVPEIASREHLKSLSQTVEYCLEKAQLDLKAIDAFAATYAPGLLGSLLVGLNFTKGLSYAEQKPFIGVHHIEGHLLSPLLEHDCKWPALGLVVSGGHTHLYRIQALGEYELLGHTVDDAIGEAYDKVAKLMGLGYPGGPIIDNLAQEGDASAFEFTLPKVKASPLHVSYSGLKTAVREYWTHSPQDEDTQKNLAASFQKTAVRIVIRMLKRALKEHPQHSILVSGGVACNQQLRAELAKLGEKESIATLWPKPLYCTDNAAMIAQVAALYLEQGKSSELNLDAQANLKLA